MSKSQLLSLSVQGLGVISDVTLDFSPGFTVITGETGAGKTLLVDALTLCAGGDSRTPRRGDELAVSAVFLLDDDREICLQRTVVNAQRLKASVDGSPTSSEALRVLGQEILSIHGQHDSLRLKNRAEVVATIDRFGGVDSSQLTDLRGELARLRADQIRFGGSDSERERQIDFARFQIDEIDRAAISSPTEIEESLERLQSLTAIQDQMVAIQRVADQLEAEDGIGEFVHSVSSLTSEGEVGVVRSQLLDAIRSIRAAVGALSSLTDPENVDPEEIDTLNRRVDTLRSLARKYGGDLSSVLSARQEAESVIHNLGNAAEAFNANEVRIREVEELERREAARISHLRHIAADRFTSDVNENLPRVALPNARIEIVTGGDDGGEMDIQFYPNPGSRGGPIQHIGSGGELSRVLLAVSLVVGESGRVTVFDEIDSGIGGNVAQSIGECLRDLSHEQQVIAVTHLASVAAQADHHFVVEKHVVDNTTRTTIRAVSGSERVTEIARMLSGDGAVTESRALAERLLQR